MFMDWLRKAPTSVVIAVIAVCGVITLGLLAVYTVLTLNGSDTAEFRQWLITVGVSIILPLLGVNTIGTISAARSASNAEDQTNGHLTALKAENERLETELRQERDKVAGLALRLTPRPTSLADGPPIRPSIPHREPPTFPDNS